MNRRSYLPETIILGLFFVAGLTIAGIILYHGAYRIKTSDRYVTVKGLAEKSVNADMAIWPVSFKVAENDLIKLYTEITDKTDSVIQFLKEAGFSENELSISPPEIKDLFAEQYYNDTTRKYRYLGKSTVTVHTRNIDLVLQSRKKVSNLVKNGIALSSDYEDKAQFNYTSLNSIKPEMIQTATLNARKAATKFAEDSDSKLGKIRNASQGQFVITDRDSNTPHIKKVRIVSTLQYYLTD